MNAYQTEPQKNANEGTELNGAAVPGMHKLLAVYTIIDIENDKALWRRVGNGFVNRDGSFNIYLDALPINGRLHMREPVEQHWPSNTGRP